MKQGINTILSLFLAAALPCALIAQPVTPSPAELIQKAIAARDAQDRQNWKYTFREDHEESQLDKDGKPGPPSTKTYDHIMLEGAEYRKLVLIDGKPLDAKTQKKVDEELKKAGSERSRNRFLSLHRTVTLATLDFLGQLFDNKVTGEEVVLGRRTWRMESEPKPGYNPANREEEEAIASRNVSWFDQEDGFRIREESVFIRATNTFQPGSTLIFEFMKVGEQWLPGNGIMRVDMKVLPGVHGRVESRQTYYDYKRFTVDSTLTPP